MPEHCDTDGRRGVLQHVNDDAGSTTTLATRGRLDIVLDLGANSGGLNFKVLLCNCGQSVAKTVNSVDVSPKR